MKLLYLTRCFSIRKAAPNVDRVCSGCMISLCPRDRIAFAKIQTFGYNHLIFPKKFREKFTLNTKYLIINTMAITLHFPLFHYILVKHGGDRPPSLPSHVIRPVDQSAAAVGTESGGGDTLQIGGADTPVGRHRSLRIDSGDLGLSEIYCLSHETEITER